METTKSINPLTFVEWGNHMLNREELEYGDRATYETPWLKYEDPEFADAAEWNKWKRANA